MANLHRGEIDCAFGGKRLKLCLTLGALAEIEAGLGVEGLAALGERLSSGRLATRDLVAIIGAAARGAGERIDDDELLRLPIGRDLPAMVEAVATLLGLAFASDGATENPPPPQALT
ncbi:MAG: hypothetical protein BGP06_15245 [Rhizobiales bacterium 65-9]|nr:gene transfer agent family protein [Hyphomicrobiales bacterium]OJY37853.1 MAG: hypothetical protein BGP06_15245 [Rhizobiales bacterium 65-9]